MANEAFQSLWPLVEAQRDKLKDIIGETVQEEPTTLSTKFLY